MRLGHARLAVAESAPSSKEPPRLVSLVKACSSSVSGSKLNRDVTHGVLMVLAWVIFMPFGSASTNWKRLLPERWFYVHASLVSAGSVLFAIALCLLIGRDDRAKDSKVDTHYSLAIAVISLWLIQLSLGALRPNKKPEDGADSVASPPRSVPRGSGRTDSSPRRSSPSPPPPSSSAPTSCTTDTAPETPPGSRSCVPESSAARTPPSSPPPSPSPSSRRNHARSRRTTSNSRESIAFIHTYFVHAPFTARGPDRFANRTSVPLAPCPRARAFARGPSLHRSRLVDRVLPDGTRATGALPAFDASTSHDSP